MDVPDRRGFQGLVPTHDPELNVVVAVSPDLPGCMTQANTFEEAREDLIDAIELWLTVGLKNSEEMPVINGARLATSFENLEGTAQAYGEAINI